MGLVQDCLFLNNTNVGDGGGFWGGAVIVERCTFRGNTAGGLGGAARITHTLRDCLVAGNSLTNLVNAGGGVFAWTNALIEGCTMIGNTANLGGGISMLPGQTVISNCILWDNSALFAGQQVWQAAPTLGTTATVLRYSVIQGGPSGVETDPDLFNAPLLENILEVDPLFLDSAGHLSAGSPCRNAGDPTTLVNGRGDLDLQPRIAGERIDMGSDERWDGLVLGLVSPGIAGLPNRVRVDNASPGSLVAFFWGLSPGHLPIPFGACPTLALSIADAALLGVEIASPLGSAMYAQAVPSAASGATVFLQALSFAPATGCDTSNLISQTYP